MDQREYRRGSADSQGQREQGGNGKNRRQPEQPQGVAKIAG